MAPSRLPSNARSVMLRDTIELDDLRLAWPGILSDRHRVSKTLVNTQVWRACFNRRKQTSRQPQRSFTNLSARALASELAAQDSPEKHICPHLSSSRAYHEDQVKGPSRRNSTSVNNAAQPKPSAKTTRSPETDHGSIHRLDKLTSGRDLVPQTQPVRPKDPKSFTQALFDTRAFKDFFVTPDYRSRPRISEDRSSFDDEAWSETIAGLKTTEENHGIKIRKGAKQLAAEPQASTNRLRPKTFSHFSKENVEVLVRIAYKSYPPQLMEQAIRNWVGPTDGDSTVVSPGSIGTSVMLFARQSIIYVLSNLSALSLSFKHESNSDGHPCSISDSFNDMVQAFSRLQKLEGYPPIIIPSLLQAAHAFYASLVSIENSERLLKKEVGSALRDSMDEDHPTTVHEVKPKIEASHIANIIFAALVATVPPCNEHVWLVIRECHREGVMTLDRLRYVMDIQSLHSVLGAFENTSALELLAKLVKILSSSASAIAMTKKAVSEDDTPYATPKVYKHVVEWIVDRLCTLGVKPFALSENGAALQWKYDMPSPEAPGMDDLSYMAIIVEWLAVLAIKQWDGKPDVDLSSTTGNALEVLRRFSESFTAAELRKLIKVQTNNLVLLALHP
ncbi:MAG: hypothetical protein Q9221_006968 [Calogaya cf. arnoldii]